MDSIKKNKKGILIMLVAAALACLGQLFWKLSASHGIWLALLGFGFYGLGAILMLLAYRYGSVSVLQPVLSTNYILSILLGYLVLQEKITLNKILGIFVIIIGVVFIAGGDE